MHSCPYCNYYLEEGSIFCSNCGTRLVEYKIFPESRHITLFEKGEYIINFENTGILPIKILNCSDQNFRIGHLSTVEPKKSEAIKLTYDLLPAGRHGVLKLCTSADIKGQEIEFRYNIISKPELKFSVRDGIEKNGIWLIPREKSKATMLDLRTDIPIMLINDKISKKDAENPVFLNSPNIFENSNYFEFIIKNTENLDAGARICAEGLLCFQGFSKEIEFNFETCEFASILLDIESTRNNRMLDTSRGINLIEIIKDSQLPISLKLFYDVRNGTVSIDRVSTSGTLRRLSDNAEIPASGLISCRSGRDFLGRQFSANGDSDNRIEIDLEVDPTNTPDALFHNQKFPVSAEIQILIHYSDIDNGFQKTDNYNLTLRFLPRKEIEITIDFGTTNSCIAYIDSDTSSINPYVAEITDYGSIIKEVPTFIKFLSFFNKEGKKLGFLKEEIEIGSVARDLVLSPDFQDQNLSSIAWGFKSLLHKETRLIYSDYMYRTELLSPVELVSLYLRSLIMKFEASHPYKAVAVHLTYPATFSQYEKSNLKEALLNLGYSEDDIIMEVAEPLGLAAYYANTTISELIPGSEKSIAVFDCGGGTTDITLARFFCRKDNTRILEFIASDGVFCRNKETTLGGNYLTYLIAKGIKDKIEQQEGALIPFPDNFRLPVEIEQDAQRANYSVIFSQAEKLKTGILKNTIGIANLIMEDGSKKSFQAIAISQAELNSYVQEDLSQAISRINLMFYLIDEDSYINLCEKGQNEKITVVWAKGIFIRFYKITHERKELLDHISTEKYEFDSLLGEYQKLYDNKKVPSIFFDEIILIGFPNNDKTIINIIKKDQNRARIIFFEHIIDVLILGGNSSRLPYLRELAGKLISARAVIPDRLEDIDWVKTGVVTGACQLGVLDDDSRGYAVRQKQILPYAIGYMRDSKFVPLLSHWKYLDDSTYTDLSEPFHISRRSKGIPIFENRDITDPSPDLLKNHNKLLQPIIGIIKVPVECIGKYIKFCFAYHSRKGMLCYNLFCGDSKESEFKPVSWMIPLRGDDE